MEGSTLLRLAVEKGPRVGETLECRPGSRIRIGRVMKGNDFTIRDPAISQNHLLLHHPLPAAAGWAVIDLGTSNGTLINGNRIPPDVPHRLADGDTISIGESTSISVNISAAVVSGAPPRAGRKGRANAAAAAAAASTEIVQVATNAGRGRRRPPRTRSASGRVPELVVVEEDDPTAGGGGEVVGGGGGEVDEMEKMTLGEWFDRMERYLPEAINDVCEEIISELRERSRRFDEFVARPPPH